VPQPKLGVAEKIRRLSCPWFDSLTYEQTPVSVAKFSIKATSTVITGGVTPTHSQHNNNEGANINCCKHNGFY